MPRDQSEFPGRSGANGPERRQADVESEGVANESTPLLGQLDDLRRQFDDALQEESGESKVSVWTLLKVHPAAVIIAFSLFCIMILTIQAVPQLIQSLKDHLGDIATVDLQYTELKTIGFSEMEFGTKSEVFINYSAIQSSIYATTVAILASMMGTLDLKLPYPMSVRALVDEKFEHITMAHINDTITLNISNGSSTALEFDVELFDLGRSDAVGPTVTKLINGEEVEFLVEGPVVVSKLGLEFTTQVSILQRYQKPNKDTWDSRIARIGITQTPNGSLVFDGIGEFTMKKEFFPLRASIPSIDWCFKLSKCDPQHFVDVAGGFTRVIDIYPDMTALNVSIGGVLDELPSSLTHICTSTDKSPLDHFISGYLNSETNYVYIESLVNDATSTIIDRLLSSINIPIAVNGKSPNEHLVNPVVLNEVEFENPSLIPSDEVTFSAVLTGTVHLPAIIDLHESAEVGLDEFRGNIHLFHNDVQFGSLHLTEWVPCETVRHEKDQFEVTVFLHNAIFEVTDSREFVTVTRELLLNEDVAIFYDTLLDVQVGTSLGQLLVTKLALAGNTTLSK